MKKEKKKKNLLQLYSYVALNVVPVIPIDPKITLSWENRAPRVQFEYFIKKVGKSIMWENNR